MKTYNFIRPIPRDTIADVELLSLVLLWFVLGVLVGVSLG